MQSMRALCFAALAFAATAATAASPDVKFSVTPLPANVSWSRDLPVLQQTYSAIEVAIRNDDSSTVNDVRFEVCARVTDDASPTGPTFAQCVARPLEAVLAPALPAANCTRAASDTAVSCRLGTLRGRGGSVTFVLVFKAPGSGPAIRYDAVASYGEGQTDSTGASHVDTQIRRVVVPLGPPLGTEVRSYLPGAGALFTGTDGVPKNGNDRWTTVVAVPKAAKVEVVEALSAQSCSADLLICVTSTATIPGSYEFLTFKLRRAPDSVANGAKIGNNRPSYEPGEIVGGVWVPSGPRVDVQDCNADGSIPTGQTRCLLSAIVYTKKNAPTPAFEGVWEYVIKARENGRTYF